MGKVTELEAIKAIDEALGSLEDQAARDRILAWARDKFAPSLPPSPVAQTSPQDPTAKSRTARKHRAAGSSTSTSEARKRPKAAALSMVKDLDLRPKGKQSFKDFASLKSPNSLHEKCVVVVYYLKNELSLPTVSASHVYTCFKHVGWRVPANLRNKLAFAASKFNWLDTKNMDSIQLTPMGENLVEHDLPKKKGKRAP
jgi:hypothetical protein